MAGSTRPGWVKQEWPCSLSERGGRGREPPPVLSRQKRHFLPFTVDQQLSGDPLTDGTDLRRLGTGGAARFGSRALRPRARLAGEAAGPVLYSGGFSDKSYAAWVCSERKINGSLSG